MKNTELVQQIVEILGKKNKLTAQEIAYQIKGQPAMIQVNGVLGKLKNSGELRVETSEKIRYFSLVAPEKKVDKNSSRDLGRYDFNGLTNLSKGRLALEVVRKYVTEKKPTLKELKSKFPDEIAKPYGVFQIKSAALSLSPDPKRKRYFIDDTDQIKLDKEKKTIVITNQWTQDRFLKFLMIAEEELKFKIKPSV